MIKFITILYLILFGSYILFTRQPDFFDGEITTGTVANNGEQVNFFDGNKAYTIEGNYIFTSLQKNNTVKVIYETRHPQKAVPYRIWGYWLLWQEIVGSIVGWILLFQIAVGINKNPTAEALKEQLEYNPRKKTKYDA
jgi:hypothetical protein